MPRACGVGSATTATATTPRIRGFRAARSASATAPVLSATKEATRGSGSDAAAVNLCLRTSRPAKLTVIFRQGLLGQPALDQAERLAGPRGISAMSFLR